MALGHTVAGVEGVYDRHQYIEEKRAAGEALTAQVKRILSPQANVIALPSADRRLSATKQGAATL